MKFQWDEEKNQLNKAKHKISFETAAYVFADPKCIELYDTKHSMEEDRFIAIGKVGEVLFVEMPEVGDELNQGEEYGVVESSKVASDLIAPLSGEVVEINERLDDEPEYINEDPYDAWIVKVKIADEDELENLLNSYSYEASID